MASRTKRHNQGRLAGEALAAGLLLLSAQGSQAPFED